MGGSNSKRAIWELTDEPYHTEIRSWYVDHFYDRCPLGRGRHRVKILLACLIA